MDIPVVRAPHSDVAVALVAQCLEAYDGGTPGTGLEHRLDSIMEAGEIPQLITALAYLAATLAITASQSSMELAETIGVSTDGLSPEALLATLHHLSQPAPE